MKTEIAVQGARQTGIAQLGEGPSVLSEAKIAIPISGKVRPGIKVLKRSLTNNPKAVEIYQRGYAKGISFDGIERELKKQCDLSHPLVPKNVSFFRVVPADFKMPANAKEIMDKYGTDGDEGYQLYRFPVVLPMDAWQAVMPHQLQCWSAGERRFWSEYGPDNNRYCFVHAKVEPGQRVMGRAKVLRADDDIPDGRCSPEDCPQYQKGECKLSGKFLFYVPGIIGAGVIELPTTSFYAMNAARSTLEMVSHLRGGKISGTIGGKPIFWISKAHREISRIDPADGKAKRVYQWLIQLEADVDMISIFQAQEAPARLTAGTQAAAALGYESEMESEFDEPGLNNDAPGDVGAAATLDGDFETADDAQSEPLCGEVESGQGSAAPELSEGALMKAVADAKDEGALSLVADVLREVKDKEVLQRVRAAMADKFKNLKGDA